MTKDWTLHDDLAAYWIVVEPRITLRGGYFISGLDTRIPDGYEKIESAIIEAAGYSALVRDYRVRGFICKAAANDKKANLSREHAKEPSERERDHPDVYD